MAELDPVEGLGLAVGWGGLAEGPGVDWWAVDMLSTSEMDADGNGGLIVMMLMQKGFFLHVGSCMWCMGLPAMAYMNQKAVSSYTLLQVKPKLPDLKIRPCSFLDAKGVGIGTGNPQVIMCQPIPLPKGTRTCTLRVDICRSVGVGVTSTG